MTYHLPSDLHELIERRISSGAYANGEDVLRDALVSLSKRDEEVQAIREGIADMEAGRVLPLRDFDRQFRLRKNIAPDDR